MDKTPEILYHYTDQVGLLGIINSQTMWATKIHYLNDSKEVWHAFNITENEILNRLSQTDDSRVKKKLEALRYKIKTVLGITVYVCSFSERADALSQWRSYVGNQPGFALGFNFDKLKKIAEQNNFNLHPCIYEQSQQDQRLSELLDSVMETDFDTRRYHIDPNKPQTIFVPKIGGDYIDKLVNIAPLLKHSAFEDEKEWRLVSKITQNYVIKFRPGKSTVIPYLEIKLNTDGYLSCLEKVVIGPSAHKDLAISSVEELLSKSININPKPEVFSSEAPFRYW